MDPNVFISCSTDATNKLWDIRMSKCVQTFTDHETDINSVKFISNGLGFVSGSDDSTIRLFDIRAYRELQVYRDPLLLCGVTSVTVSPSGKYITAGSHT